MPISAPTAGRGAEFCSCVQTVMTIVHPQLRTGVVVALRIFFISHSSERHSEAYSVVTLGLLGTLLLPLGVDMITKWEPKAPFRPVASPPGDALMHGNAPYAVRRPWPPPGTSPCSMASPRALEVRPQALSAFK